MAGRSVNIYLKEDIYQEIRQESNNKNVSRLVNEIVTEYLIQKKNQRAEELRLQMIAGYQENSRDQKLKQELENIENSCSRELFKIKKK
jgi:L-arabinose isomerase